MMNQKIKVVHVLYSGFIGGTERALYQLTKNMAKRRDLDITVAFSIREGPFFEKMHSAGVKIWIAGLHNGWDFPKFPRIYRFMNKFDIHHFHNVSLIFILASSLCRGKQRIYTHRAGIRAFPFLKRMKDKIMGSFLRHFFSTYSGNTAAACDAAAKRFSIPRDLFHVVYNGLDLQHIRTKRSKREIYKELGIKRNAFIVGTMAHLKEGKRIDKLIHLATKLDEKAVVLVIGSGPELNKLKELSYRLGVIKKVIFLGMKTNPFDYIKAMDVFILPSGPEESFGNSAVEAMALGVPTVVYKDGGGLVEHIAPNKTGYIVSDDRELFETVFYLMRNPIVRGKIGNAGKYYAKKKYSVENMIGAYSNLYVLKTNPHRTTIYKPGPEPTNS